MANNKIQGESQQYRVVKYIPLKIAYASGTPSVVFNPENEGVTLADNGQGEVTITLATASLAPIMVAGLVAECAAGTVGLAANVDSATAPTVTSVKLIVNSVADGTTETDPVALHVLLAVVRVA